MYLDQLLKTNSEAFKPVKPTRRSATTVIKSKQEPPLSSSLGSRSEKLTLSPRSKGKKAHSNPSDLDSEASCSHSVEDNRSSRSSRTGSSGIFSLFKGRKGTSQFPESISTGTDHSNTSSAVTSVHDDDLARKAKETLKNIQQIIADQEAREEELAEQVNSAMATAKTKLASGNKQAAIRYMKKAKILQNEAYKISQVITTLDAQGFSIESAINNNKLVGVMSSGSKAMKELGLSAGSVDTVMADVMDSLDYKIEVDKIMSEPVHNVIVEDDDELLRELMGLTDQKSSVTLDGSASSSTNIDMELDLPMQPSTKVGAKEPEQFEIEL